MLVIQSDSELVAKRCDRTYDSNIIQNVCRTSYAVMNCALEYAAGRQIRSVESVELVGYNRRKYGTRESEDSRGGEEGRADMYVPSQMGR